MNKIRSIIKSCGIKDEEAFNILCLIDDIKMLNSISHLKHRAFLLTNTKEKKQEKINGVYSLPVSDVMPNISYDLIMYDFTSITKAQHCKSLSNYFDIPSVCSYKEFLRESSKITHLENILKTSGDINIFPNKECQDSWGLDNSMVCNVESKEELSGVIELLIRGYYK